MRRQPIHRFDEMGLFKKFRRHKGIIYFLKGLKHPRLAGEIATRLVNLVVERYYARIDSRRILGHKEQQRKLLFVDGGANLGQGFKFFSSYFPPGTVEYDVFEPNQNCLEQLRKNLSCLDQLTVRLHPAALSTQNGFTKLFGIAEYEGGPLSVGASINQYQHSIFFDSKPEDAVSVPTIDFCNYLKSKSEYYDAIIVKLDIEGAENDVLETLIERDYLGYIDTLYVEFHSFSLKEPKRRSERLREARIIKHLKESDIHFRIWH